ncbi:hypothetical protein BLNAU_18511 [Blattamonas nauphoetae]|uniref:Uncharacterized protein n=1 Tax=Blattamonas nauphoetae TaxID=2049346 RepID=A0ABQ9X432_9EUKA|nr:hypothetical protein BLNAU_18511 [Blattamonas nauphoetae]
MLLIPPQLLQSFHNLRLNIEPTKSRRIWVWLCGFDREVSAACQQCTLRTSLHISTLHTETQLISGHRLPRSFRISNFCLLLPNSHPFLLETQSVSMSAGGFLSGLP